MGSARRSEKIPHLATTIYFQTRNLKNVKGLLRRPYVQTVGPFLTKTES